MNNKFELIKTDTKVIEGKTLYRIKALVDIGTSVKAGDLGGYIETEENLADDGDAWVYDNACVFGNAHILDSASVSERAQVYGNARVSGNVFISGKAIIYENAWVADDAWVCENAHVSGHARISGHAKVSGNAGVYGNATVSGNAQIYDNAIVYGDAIVSGNAEVTGRLIMSFIKATPDCTIETMWPMFKLACEVYKRKQNELLSKMLSETYLPDESAMLDSHRLAMLNRFNNDACLAFQCNNYDMISIALNCINNV